MYGLMLGNLNNQDFEDNRITSLACYVKKVEELYSILENENRENKENMDNDGNDSEKIHLENGPRIKSVQVKQRL